MKTLLLSLLLAGCAYHPTYEMVRDTTTITVREVPGLEQRGLAVWEGEQCVIVLRKYPECLGHEVMHCLSGYWHNGVPNDDYCDE